MELLDRLAAEHTRILSVANALDVFASEIESTQLVDVLEAVRFVTFFRGYSEGLHHEREETVLFPALVRTGLSLEFGPLTHVRDQHRLQGRLLLGLEKSISCRPPWGPGERASIVAAARAFTAFEREHISKEHELLLPKAAKELAFQQPEIDVAAQRFERWRAPRWDVPWLEALGGELEADHRARG